MPRSRKKSKDSLSDEKPRRVEPNAPRMEEVDMDAEAPAVREGERIAGLVKEYSGWDVYNNEARKVDAELVKDWTGSLNFLLLFAAIFAAVLTAFIIESKKLLEPDQTAIMVDVMMFYTNSVANGTHRLYTPPQFQPSSTDITINCLFFASLSASLVAALASVVALQWVADYDAAITRGGSSPEDRAKRRQFRYAGVVQWKMSEIIAALPILLYCSVILFFTGLILWMTATNHIVGAVVTGGAAVAVLFYGASTLISVIFVSAPFRTPLSQSIYTLCYLPSLAIYALAKMGNTLGVPLWLERQHLTYMNSRKRIDIAVEKKGELGRDALIWLANHLSISQDSHRRLVLLVGELPGLLPEHMPSFDVREASWYDIFDLLGWRFLASGQVETVSGEEKRRMEILQRCYAIPAVQAIINPPALSPDASDLHGAEYWNQFCGINGAGPWNKNAGLPNHLYRLLRDLPRPFDFSGAEMQAIVLLGRWRNTISKPPEVWDEVFALEASFHPTFLSSCVATFAKLFVRSQDWKGWDRGGKQKYFSTASELVQIATRRGDLPLPTVLLLIQAYEALLIGFGNAFIEGAACISRPLHYGTSLQQIPVHDQRVHESIILLLSRQIQSYPMEERALKVREVIALLWLRPSNPVPRRWENMEMRYGRLDQWDPVIVTDWVRGADRVPHILEILRHLARAQAEDPSTGALWRTTGTDRSSDPHFVELLQMLDRLMDRTCTASDHCMMIDLVCQDLELEQSPNFEHYFNRDRVTFLEQLHDPCLQLLANCARGGGFVNLGILTEEYRTQRRHSLNRIEEYLLKSYPEGEQLAILELKASLWPEFLGKGNLCRAALESRSILTHLQRIFRHPVPCVDCLDNVGHLPFHIVQEISPRLVYMNLFGSNQRINPSMGVDLIILWRLFKDRDMELEDIIQADAWCLQELTRMLNEIKGSLSSSLSHIWSVARHYEGSPMWPDDLAVISECTKEALRLPDDAGSTSVMLPLASRLLRLRDVLLNRGNGMLADRELAADQVVNANRLLLSRLATRLIFGQRNAVAVPCARARGIARLSVRHWAPHDE